MKIKRLRYRGRFAPSPTGALHFGSLVAAVSSYLDARANQGVWLVRIENIDRNRERQKASDLILCALEKYGLIWDETILFQNTREDAYQKALSFLIDNQYTYTCCCTRKKRKSVLTPCLGECIDVNTQSKPSAIYLKCPLTVSFFDEVYHHQTIKFSTLDVCLLKRTEGFFAYQLAVVVDDLSQKITHVVRGSDLLSSTGWQIVLIKALGGHIPHYLHVPIVKNAQGQKLSKQSYADPLPLDKPAVVLYEAFLQLNMKPEAPLRKASVKVLLDWGVAHWNKNKSCLLSE
ncbi:MAG: tRNA glutamyl-Q(34) synthetase GluQRS [Endozoicomonadaceae bacterium]|nr:tRNA glutamyl-Q(34) synthetase GluQRS [Endozoicomonadaceae bacterium]